MRASCLAHPKLEPILVIRKWQIDFCDGDKCAAALLSVFAYWHDIKLAMLEKNKKTNDIAEMHGDSRTQDEGLLQFHTMKELGELIFGLYSKNNISKSCQLLVDKGAITITKNPNPKYSFDRTNYYQFHPEICNDWLCNTYPTIDRSILGNRESKNKRRSPKNDPPSPKFGQAITETTTETSSEITTNKNSRSNKRVSTETISPFLSADISSRKVDVRTEPSTASAAKTNKKINTKVEPSIGDDLTKAQKEAVWQEAKSLAQQYPEALQGKQPKALFAELCHELLNTTSWTKAGNDFFHRLNIFKKRIKEGAWTTPTSLTQALERGGSHQEGQNALVQTIQEAQVTLQHCLYEFNSKFMQAERYKPSPNKKNQEAFLRHYQIFHEQAMVLKPKIFQLVQAFQRKGIWDYIKPQLLPREITLLRTLLKQRKDDEDTTHEVFIQPFSQPSHGRCRIHEN